MYRVLVFLILLFITPVGVIAQNISGVVRNKQTNDPIAFVNISIPGTTKGTTTDIDGNFEFEIPTSYSGKLLFSHISYDKKYVNTSSIIETIFLKSKTTNLNELTFTAKENPAYRIIRNTIANKNNNNPGKLKSYTYKSYNKEVFNIDVNKLRLDSLTKLLQENDTFELTRFDSTQFKLDNFSNTQHVMLIESVAETKFASPGMVNEKVLATKISGISSPLFASTGSQYRSFGFYEDVIKVMDKEYLNPIMNGGLNKYEFYIEDTTFYQSDTVYVISFEPRKNKRFEGLKGMLSICVDGYAIKNVVAQTADPLSTVDMRIQQLYERINGEFFPVQLNTDIAFKENSLIGSGFKMEGRSYLSEINLDAGLTNKAFGDVVFEIPRIEDDENVRILKESRFVPLDSIDIATYEVWDTLAPKIDKYIKIVEILATERIPVGPFDIKINDVFRSNMYENVRLGIGGATNSKLLTWATVGGYVAYGIKDKAWKYGGNFQVELNKRTSTYLRGAYSNDIAETGRVRFFNADRIINEESLRNLQSSQFDKVERLEIELHSRILPFTYASATVSHERIIPTYLYAYQLENGSSILAYNISEASLSFRYVKNEGYVKFLDVKMFPQNDFPMIKAKITKSIDLGFGNWFDYTRYDFSLAYKKKYRLGKSSIYLRGALIDGNFPYGKGITSWGNRNAYFNVPNYFQTMGLYEFLSDKAVGLFLNHNFGNVLLDNKYTKPELLIYHNMAIGELKDSSAHQLVAFNTMEEGYFESGIGIKNLIRFNYMQLIYIGFGGDVFYRYGTYAFPEIADNFAFTFNMTIGF